MVERNLVVMENGSSNNGVKRLSRRTKTETDVGGEGLIVDTTIKVVAPV